MTAAEIAKLVNGEVVGNGAVELHSFAPADHAKRGDLTFAENEEYLTQAEQSAASAVLAGKNATSTKKVLIRVANPRVAFAQVLPLFFPEPEFNPGIHPTAILASTAKVDATAHLGPHCVVGERTSIGAHTVLQGGNHIGSDCTLEDHVNLFPNVTLYSRTQIGSHARIHAGTVIGSDGFGYVLDNGAHRKVPQIGNVIIGDNVEIGANVTVDRGALGSTVIGKGTKIDNLVQIAHNVVIGEHCIVVSQTGISGSTKLGHYVILAGQVGLAGHLKIGNQVTVAGQSGVMHDIPDGEKWFGSPAQPAQQTKRQIIALRQLPDLIHRLHQLKQSSDGKSEN
jgi:UDP-3-O-[3-hydroxymyristoyl] glucosamine N-acyltransferase